MEIDKRIAEQYTEVVYRKALLMFIESNEKLVEGLEANNEDLEFKTLHKLKGGANMLGLKKIGASIEAAENDPLNQQHIDSIKEEFAEIKAYYAGLN